MYNPNLPEMRSLMVDQPTQIEVTVKYRYTPTPASYATEDNPNPTFDEMLEFDEDHLEDVVDFIDWDLADITLKPVTEKP